MKKLVQGIVEFRKTKLALYREKFAHLAKGQSPDTLFFTCSDSRVAPNWFASTDPGDLFVVRNVGNLIPCCDTDGVSHSDESEAAAIEFALNQLKVKDIIVCGHSDCGAMSALLSDRKKIQTPNLKSWLRHGEPSLSKMNSRSDLAPVNELSQKNVLQQMEHLKTYPMVSAALSAGTLNIHGWWFEVGEASVYAYDRTSQLFVLIDKS